MEDIIAENTGTEIVQASSSGEDSVGPSEDEQRLADEIAQLWEVHAQAKTTVAKTKAELKAIRELLSERLFEMKRLLVKPGRNGGWSSFLRAEGIAKATADRLVRKHEESSDPQPNIVSEEVLEPGGVDVERLFESLLPRLKTHLTTPSSAYEFVFRLVRRFGLPCETADDGILVLDPSIRESPGANAAPVPVGQAAAVADGGSGGLV